MILFKIAQRFEASNLAQLAELQNSLRGCSSAANRYRGAIFECFALRRLAQGGKFDIERLSGSLSTYPRQLDISTTCESVKLDKQKLSECTPLNAAIGQRTVLACALAGTPTVDALLLNQTASALFQMTVSTTHPLIHMGIVQAVKYLDSVAKQDEYNLYFVVPPDVYDNFNKVQKIEGSKGEELKSLWPEARRINQFKLKIGSVDQ